ncbi:MAG: hypothetical protein L6R39_001604 [Caloplaca ligustica]|nr:MAG: hypothetical protein L6R39_001604 [Caloplaca ligustica]
MVSTRNHPSNFPPPDLSPSKAAATHPMSSSTGPWAHKPTVLTVLWLIVSLPLVIWDSIYVLGRPHTMPGGKWHEPVYTPYALYATVDYMYGWPAYESGNGFTMAQCSLNVLETICYLAYLYIFWEHGEGQWTGLWIVLPAYMVYAFGTDILQGLSIAGGDQSTKPAKFSKPRPIYFSKDTPPTKDE